MKKGFTLIELMVVIVIIGILATLGLVSFQNALRRSRDAKRIGIVKDAAAAQEQLKALSGSYDTTCGVGDTIGSLEVPSDPSSNSRYQCFATADNFCISSEMETNNNGNCGVCTNATSRDTSVQTHFCMWNKQ